MTDTPAVASAVPAISAAPVLPAVHRAPVRLVLLARSARVMVTSLAGAVLFSLWITAVALCPLTLLAPLVLPLTSCVRGYANRYRRDAHRLTGVCVETPYRAPAARGVIGRVWATVRDPASWRDAWWLLAHSVTACTTAALSLALFTGGIFYVIYPFLYWVTPEQVFARPFGGWELHSLAQSTLLMPLAAVPFGLWYLLAIPLTRVEIGLTRSLLAPRADRPGTGGAGFVAGGRALSRR